ncbi:MAG TPA: DNA-formamidopyrimidine glycosylase family protein [Anaeromyxobacteraceae bacterium]|nr:DNA-formamidopyrimidine glycosylase family protein [Anaeromyxobacteraceae bacterium]
MPELPDLTVYVEAIAARVEGRPLERVRVATPFLVRTAAPPLAAAHGRTVRGVRRVGKRIVLALDGDLFLALHLMIAGRLHWKEPGARLGGRAALAAFDFAPGSLTLTEAGTQRRAALHLVAGEAALRALDKGGLEPLEAGLDAFAAALRRERHTLKRALTDPGLFAGIGNAYSDEILHRARLSPVAMTTGLDDAAVARLHAATGEVLREWTERLRAQAAGGFPEGVTAFRPEMAVHGRHRLPCPVCGTLVQRIVRAANEVDYCPRCQTGGRILSDRSLARLLKADWPRTIDELEQHPALSRARAPEGRGAKG